MPRYPSDDYNYGVPHVRQPRYPSMNAPTPEPASPYAPPPPAYTSNQWAQHANAIADVDRQIAAETNPEIKAQLLARKNEMQYAYRSHQPYPNYAARARDQQGLKTDVSVANAGIAGQTASNVIRAQAPIAVAGVRAQGQVEAKRIEGETKQNTVAATNATKEKVAGIGADAKKYGADAAARARTIAAKIKAASTIGGVGVLCPLI